MKSILGALFSLLPAFAVGAPVQAANPPKNFYLSDTWEGGNAGKEFFFGDSSGTPVTGDWDGNGTDTIGVRTGKVFHLRNFNSEGGAHYTVTYGRVGDEVLIGDWDGNGTDTLGIRRVHEFHLRNDLTSGPPTTYSSTAEMMTRSSSVTGTVTVRTRSPYAAVTPSMSRIHSTEDLPTSRSPTASRVTWRLGH